MAYFITKKLEASFLLKLYLICGVNIFLFSPLRLGVFNMIINVYQNLVFEGCFLSFHLSSCIDNEKIQAPRKRMHINILKSCSGDLTNLILL